MRSLQWIAAFANDAPQSTAVFGAQQGVKLVQEVGVACAPLRQRVAILEIDAGVELFDDPKNGLGLA